MSDATPPKRWSDNAVARARSDALEWLSGNDAGFPRSWEQEALNEISRGYALYDEFDAPTIAGYEALEREGLAVRISTVNLNGEDRIKFALAALQAKEPPHER